MRKQLRGRPGVIVSIFLMVLVALFIMINTITTSAVQAQVGGCSTLTPSRPFLYANPSVIQSGETGVCSETQPTVNGVAAAFGGYGPYSWFITETVSGAVFVETGAVSVTVEVAQVMPTTTVEYDAVTFSAGPYPIAVTAYPSEVSNGVVTDTFQITGWQWNFFEAPGRTVWYWNEDTGQLDATPTWDDEYLTMVIVGPALSEICNQNLPVDAWVFANPSYLHNSELGACADEQPSFNSTPATLIADPNRPYNWSGEMQSGQVIAVAGNNNVTVDVHQVVMSETLVVPGVAFIANTSFGMSVVEYAEITSTQTITHIYQVTGWAWDFLLENNTNVQYWDYITGQWGNIPSWRDHMFLAITQPVPQPQDPNCYTSLPEGMSLFANPAYLNNGETGLCSDIQPTFNGTPGVLLENSTLPYNWQTTGITGNVTVSGTELITATIAQIDEGELHVNDVITLTAAVNPVSLVEYPVVEDNLFKYYRMQVSGWQYNYEESPDVWGGYYWDWETNNWQALPVPGNKWRDHMLFEFRIAQQPASFTYYLYIPLALVPPTQVNINPIQDGMEHVTSQQIEGETDFNITFPQSGEFDWSVGIWVTTTSSVNVTYAGQTINVNWKHVPDGTTTGHYEADPFWQNLGPVQAGATFKIHLEKGEWINLGYRYR